MRTSEDFLAIHPWPIPRHAGLGIRTMSKLVDSLVILALFTCMWVMAGTLGYRWLFIEGALEVVGIGEAFELLFYEAMGIAVLSGSVALAYPVVMRSACGQTVGEAIWELRLLDNGGGEAGTGKIVKRGLLSILSMALLGAGYWWALFDDQRQTLHGKWSGTIFARY
jgi:uncharacterized RDD family membrane protein YckC